MFPQRHKRIELLSLECEENMMLDYDKKWTEEAIFNVLDNAVKYTVPGERFA